MIRIADKSQCSGCSACYAVCPKNAIGMRPDALGFRYPEVDASRCVECGLCLRVCEFNPDYSTPDNYSRPRVYAARQKNMEEVMRSRSGGVFAALSDKILDRGGAVYGAGYAEGFRVVHKRALTPGERDEFRGSKYVQSDMEDVFRSVERDLKAGLEVLFSGTGCQISGLGSFLRLRHVDTSRLLLCDIVCHGVPSPRVWKEYLQFIENRYRERVTAVDFRDKRRFGWSAHQESLEVGGREVTSTLFTRIFLARLAMRPSCAVCPFTNMRRTGDITLGDFWGWQRINADINADDKGLSLLLINTSKGQRALEEIEDKLRLLESTPENCTQPNLCHPTEINPLAAAFQRDFEQSGLEKTLRRYGFIGWKSDLKGIMEKFKSGLVRIITMIDR